MGRSFITQNCTLFNIYLFVYFVSFYRLLSLAIKIRCSSHCRPVEHEGTFYAQGIPNVQCSLIWCWRRYANRVGPNLNKQYTIKNALTRLSVSCYMLHFACDHPSRQSSHYSITLDSDTLPTHGSQGHYTHLISDGYIMSSSLGPEHHAILT